MVTEKKVGKSFLGRINRYKFAKEIYPEYIIMLLNKNKYKDCILFLQHRLINEFEFKEKFKDKVKRKIFTGYMKS